MNDSQHLKWPYTFASYKLRLRSGCRICGKNVFQAHIEIEIKSLFSQKWIQNGFASLFALFMKVFVFWLCSLCIFHRFILTSFPSSICSRQYRCWRSVWEISTHNMESSTSFKWCAVTLCCGIQVFRWWWTNENEHITATCHLWQSTAFYELFF